MLPTRWNELHREQLLAICRLSLEAASPTEVKAKALFLLLGFKIERMKERVVGDTDYFYVSAGKQHLYLLGAVDVMFMCKHLDFMFQVVEKDNGEKQYQFRSKLYRNLLPKVKVGRKLYYGPEDGLTNVLFGEYIRCEMHYANFLMKNEKLKIKNELGSEDLLIATMYRKERKDYDPSSVSFSGDRREEYNDFVIEKRARVISKLKPEEKQAILFYYEGCKNFLAVKYPNVFEDSGSGSGSSSKQTVLENYLKLVTSLAKNDATRVKDWMDTNVHGVFFAMENMILEQKSIEAVYK